MNKKQVVIIWQSFCVTLLLINWRCRWSNLIFREVYMLIFFAFPVALFLPFPIVSSLPCLPELPCFTLLVVKNVPAAKSPRQIPTFAAQRLTGWQIKKKVFMGGAGLSLCPSVSAPALSGSGRTPCGRGCRWVVSIAATEPHPAPQRRLTAPRWSESRSDLTGILEREREREKGEVPYQKTDCRYSFQKPTSGWISSLDESHAGVCEALTWWGEGGFNCTDLLKKSRRAWFDNDYQSNQSIGVLCYYSAC